MVHNGNLLINCDERLNLEDIARNLCLNLASCAKVQNFRANVTEYDSFGHRVRLYQGRFK